MNKNDFYMKAMNARLFVKRAWVISALALITEDYSAWMKNPYEYRIVQTPTGFFFCDPANDLKLTPIDDAETGKPLFNFKHPISLPAGSMINLKKDVDTTIGNVFFNFCCMTYAFGDKFDFLEGSVSVSKIEKRIAERMEDDGIVKPGAIFVSEYLKFTNSIGYLTNFTQLCVWAATEKLLKAPPGIVKFKNKLLEENKDRLTDPLVIAQIDAELVKFDAAYLKGDPCENFLISDKSRKIVRKKMFLMHGAEVGLSEGVGVDLIQNSLEQGWQPSKFSTMNDSLRAGAYNRGIETALGGDAVKWLLRTSSNITATVEDCGTTLGKTVDVSVNNVRKLIGLNVMVDGKPVLVDNSEDADTYMGKKLIVRSPMYCNLDKTDYCFTCIGKRLANNPTAISIAVAEYGSKFQDLFMQAGHAKAILLAKMDYKKSII